MSQRDLWEGVEQLRAELQHSRESTGKLINQAAKQIRELEVENERLQAKLEAIRKYHVHGQPKPGCGICEALK